MSWQEIAKQYGEDVDSPNKKWFTSDRDTLRNALTVQQRRSFVIDRAEESSFWEQQIDYLEKEEDEEECNVVLDEEEEEPQMFNGNEKIEFSDEEGEGSAEQEQEVKSDALDFGSDGEKFSHPTSGSNVYGFFDPGKNAATYEKPVGDDEDSPLAFSGGYSTPQAEEDKETEEEDEGGDAGAATRREPRKSNSAGGARDLWSDDEDESEEEEESTGDGEEGRNPMSKWMQRFQNTLTTIRSFDTNTPLEVLMAANAELLHLSQDFLHCARTYGRIIISERFLDVDHKTIKPAKLGGLAGGEKYIVHNVLFKFAVDSEGILGSDYAAAKVAGNELKGLISYFNCGVRELRVPLMALVDYMGFRLVAMSLLPITKDTLVYGTNDGGFTIYNEDKKLSKFMRKAAENINIKSHICGLLNQNGKVRKGWKLLHSAADVEGHKGLDDNFYLLDFSRVLPPEQPDPKVKASHLYRLLRPEFVKAYPRPLCSDAFSGFIMADPSAGQHNKEIQDATEYLNNETIPKFVRDSLTWQILEAKEKGQLHTFRLAEAIHAKGLCMRHIGRLLHHVRDEDQFQEVKTLLVVEALGRVLKNMLRAKLRKKMKRMKQPLEAPYRNLVIRYLNLVFGKSAESTQYWNTVLKRELKAKFSVDTIITEEIFPLKIILTAWDTPAIEPAALLFSRVQALTGLKFTPLATRKYTGTRIRKAFQSASPFDDSDLAEIGERVKHMNIVAEALGSYYHYKGIYCRLDGDNRGAMELFGTAIEKYEEALGSNPTNKQLLRLCALCWERLNELQMSKGQHIEEVKFSLSDSRIQKTDQYYIRAVEADRNDAFTLYSYAKFLWRCNRVERAEEYFLQSLEADPSYTWCIRDYGKFIAECGDLAEGDKMFKLSSAIQQRQASKESQGENL